jgi:predicted dehydrogenase
MEDVQLIVSDSNGSQAAAAAAQWGVEQVPIEKFFDSPLDAVDVCVPSAVHTQWIIDAVKAGLHVFCEKPLCLSHAEAVAIRDAAIRSQRNVIVGYLYRHHPSFKFAKETLEHGIIGAPYFAFGRLGGRGSHRQWKHDPATGGGVLFEMMVHLLDLFSWLLGPLSEGRLVYRDLLLPERNIDGEDVAVAADDCAALTFRAGPARALCQSDLATPSFTNYVEIQGTNGSLLASIVDFIPTVVYCKEPRVLFDRGHNFRSFGPINLFHRELEEFVRIVRSGELNWWSLLESIDIAAFLENLVLSDPR